MTTTANTKVIKKDKKKVDLNPYSIIVGISLIIYTISFIIPLVWGLMTSFKSEYQFFIQADVLGLPTKEGWAMDLTTPGNFFGNYEIAFSFMHFNRTTQYVVGIFNQRLHVATNEAGIFECVLHTR